MSRLRRAHLALRANREPLLGVAMFAAAGLGVLAALLVWVAGLVAVAELILGGG